MSLSSKTGWHESQSWENGARLLDRIPGADLEVYPGGRHGFFEEFAQEVTPAVLEFFAGSRAS